MDSDDPPEVYYTGTSIVTNTVADVE
jgi:hypothetical protein